MDHLRVVEDLVTMLGYELLAQHGLDDWSLHWHDNGAMAGRCNRSAKIITLNRRILLDTDARNSRETLLHEIAHAHTDDSLPDHGRVWYEKLIEIGGSGIWTYNNGTVRSVIISPEKEES